MLLPIFNFFCTTPDEEPCSVLDYLVSGALCPVLEQNCLIYIPLSQTKVAENHSLHSCVPIAFGLYSAHLGLITSYRLIKESMPSPDLAQHF